MLFILISTKVVNFLTLESWSKLYIKRLPSACCNGIWTRLASLWRRRCATLLLLLQPGPFDRCYLGFVTGCHDCIKRDSPYLTNARWLSRYTRSATCIEGRLEVVALFNSKHSFIIRGLETTTTVAGPILTWERERERERELTWSDEA